MYDDLKFITFRNCRSKCELFSMNNTRLQNRRALVGTTQAARTRAHQESNTDDAPYHYDTLVLIRSTLTSYSVHFPYARSSNQPWCRGAIPASRWR